MNAGDIVYAAVPSFGFIQNVYAESKYTIADEETFVGIVLHITEVSEDTKSGVCRVLTCIDGRCQYILVLKYHITTTLPSAYLEAEAKRRAALEGDQKND